MKTNFFYAVILTVIASAAHSQSTNLGNGAGIGTEYVGWDGTGINSKDVDVINFFPRRVSLCEPLRSEDSAHISA